MIIIATNTFIIKKIIYTSELEQISWGRCIWDDCLSRFCLNIVAKDT